MKNTRGSGGFRRLELAADRFFDVERLLAIVYVGPVSRVGRRRPALVEHEQFLLPALESERADQAVNVRAGEI